MHSSSLVAARPLVENYFLDASSWATAIGFSSGLIIPQLVLYTWSWFPAGQVPVRTLAWSVLASRAIKLFAPIQDSDIRILGIRLLIPILLYHVGVAGWGLIGSPSEVSWLDAPTRLHLARRAAADKYRNDRQKEGVKYSMVRILPDP